MNKKIGLFLVFLIMLVSFSFLVYAQDSACDPTINLVNQDPNPATPSSYVTVLFEITGLGNCRDGYSINLEPSYPFSLDPNTSTLATLAGNPYAKDVKNSWMVSYTLQVDKDALDRDYRIKLQTKEGVSGSIQSFYSDGYVEREFNLSIQDSRTSFDAVIQETSGSVVSIAIANVGKYSANSMVVRIPEQASFSVSGTDGQMVGNLASGDYSLVGFTVNQKATFSGGDLPAANNRSSGIPRDSPQNLSSNKLRVDIYYTDNIGERRIESLELKLNIGNSSSRSFGMVRPAQDTSTKFYSSWVFWVVLVIVLLVLYWFYSKYSEQNGNFRERVSKILSKRARKPNLNETPDWVKKATGKSK